MHAASGNGRTHHRTAAAAHALDGPMLLDYQAESGSVAVVPEEIYNNRIVRRIPWRTRFYTSVLRINSAAHTDTVYQVTSTVNLKLPCDTCALLCPRPPPPKAGALSDDARLTSVCLSRTSGLSRYREA